MRNYENTKIFKLMVKVVFYNKPWRKLFNKQQLPNNNILSRINICYNCSALVYYELDLPLLL